MPVGAALPSFPVPAVVAAGVLCFVLVSVSLHSTAASPLKCITMPERENRYLCLK
jgi:hypothetical protein